MAMDALSQQDIDSLLTGGPRAKAAARRAAAEASGPAVEVLPYNFTRPLRISKERQAILNSIHSRFAASMQSFLSSRLRQATDVAVTSVEQVTFGEFVMALSEPCAAFVFDLGEHAGSQAVVDIGTGFAHHLVDRLFGGPGEAETISRALTPLEQMVLRGMVERVMTTLQDAWGDHLPMTPTPVGFEGMPGTLRVANKEDNVLIANLEIRTGQATGILTVCIPLIALENFLQDKAGHLMQTQRIRTEDRDRSRRTVESCVRQVSLPVIARLRPCMLTTADLATLRPGDVLLTGHHAEVDVQVLVNGAAHFAGKIGQQRGHLGIRISHRTETGSASRNPKGRLIA
jgi:flagellar motor switch protein FliM